MLKQFFIKKRKIFRGILNTYFRRVGQKYNDKEWWDNSFYTEGISDRQTISQKKSIISAKYHYNSIELQILKNLYNQQFSTHQSTVLDLGSGSGHWIDFYKSLGSSRLVGLDISFSSVNYLKDKYINQNDIEIINGKAFEIIDQLNVKFDIVNAIGVMFHIIDDSEWIETINKIAGTLKKKGLLIVGGHFGFLNGLNVQISEGQINKRLRSKKRWIRVLKKAGFSNIKVYKNNMYLWINDPLPENNVLIAEKL